VFGSDYLQEFPQNAVNVLLDCADGADLTRSIQKFGGMAETVRNFLATTRLLGK
jgi:hypothetical protein